MEGRFSSSPPTDDPTRYVILQSDSPEGEGNFLRVVDGQGASLPHQLCVDSDVADASMWVRVRGGFRSATTGLELTAEPFGPETGVAPHAVAPALGGQAGSPLQLSISSMVLSPVGEPLASANPPEAPTDGAGVFTAFGGPLRLPSHYAAEMQEKGYTIVEGLIVREVLEHLATEFARVEQERESFREARANPASGNFCESPADRQALRAVFSASFAGLMCWCTGMMDMMKEDAGMTRMCANPVTLSLMRGYFGAENIAFGHTPIVNVLKPVEQATQAEPRPGWHSDYPYGHARNMFDATIVLGIQCNICFDEVRPRHKP
jgi:hypothetical protein